MFDIPRAGKRDKDHGRGGKMVWRTIYFALVWIVDKVPMELLPFLVRQ